MTLILAFIAAHMGFLWEGARYHIVGSEVTTYNGGDALLVVESDVLRLRFIRDRGQLFLDVQPAAESQEGTWFSIDLVRRLFLNHREMSAELDEGYAEFLRERLRVIEARFSASAWPDTFAQLKKLKIKRAKELFG
jgi:hypothetical protein